MKGLNKLVLVSAIAAAPFAQAELKAIDDATMSEMTGQSGLLIEVAFGSTAATAGVAKDTDGVITGFDGQAVSIGADEWSNAGITIEAFKWEIDLEGYSQTSNIHANSITDSTAAGYTTGDTALSKGGFIAQDIRIAGAVDMTVDGVVDAGTGHGGLAIGFANSDISLRVGNMAFYGATGVSDSMGAIEIVGMNIDNLDLTISGRGASNVDSVAP